MAQVRDPESHHTSRTLRVITRVSVGAGTVFVTCYETGRECGAGAHTLRIYGISYGHVLLCGYRREELQQPLSFRLQVRPRGRR